MDLVFCNSPFAALISAKLVTPPLSNCVELHQHARFQREVSFDPLQARQDRFFTVRALGLLCA